MKEKIKPILKAVFGISLFCLAIYAAFVRPLIKSENIAETLKLGMWSIVGLLAICVLAIGLSHLYHLLDSKGYGGIFKGILIALFVVIFLFALFTNNNDDDMLTCELCDEKYDFAEVENARAFVSSGETVCINCILRHYEGRCKSCGIYSILKGEFIDGYCRDCYRLSVGD